MGLPGRKFFYRESIKPACYSDQLIPLTHLTLNQNHTWVRHPEKVSRSEKKVLDFTIGNWGPQIFIFSPSLLVFLTFFLVSFFLNPEGEGVDLQISLCIQPFLQSPPLQPCRIKVGIITSMNGERAIITDFFTFYSVVYCMSNSWLGHHSEKKVHGTAFSWKTQVLIPNRNHLKVKRIFTK